MGETVGSDSDNNQEVGDRLDIYGFRAGEDDGAAQAKANRAMGQVNAHNEVAAPIVARILSEELRENRARLAVEAGKQGREFFAPKPTVRQHWYDFLKFW